MKLDKALGFAVILSWEDLAKVQALSSARVEYRSAPGRAVHYLSVWSVDGEGHQIMVCDYWTWTGSSHPDGICFSGKFQSQALGRALDFILKNQDQFTRVSDACPEGLALVYPPTGDELTEATAWISGVHGAATNIGHAGKESAATL